MTNRKAELSTLRERTGASLRDCNDALSSVNGDLEKATVLLRQRQKRGELGITHLDPALGRRSLLAAVMMDGSFLAAEILVEEALWEWANIGLLASAIVFAFWGLRLVVGYSVHHGVAPACIPLHQQLGVPGLGGLAAAGKLLVGALAWLVAAGLPVGGISLVLSECGHPGGIDSFETGTLHKNALNGGLFVVMIFSLYITYSAESLFRGKARVTWEKPALDYAVPGFAIMIGASLPIVGHHLLTDGGSLGISTEALLGVGFYLYLPMRYLLCRAAGLTPISLLLWVLTIAAYWYIG